MISPGEVPCFLLLSGIQVPRVIGKKGALIRELRQESGATIEILDRPPAIPEAFQRCEQRVARIRGSDAAMHAALVGLIRNAAGPEALRELEPDGERDSDVQLLVPAKVEDFMNEQALLEGTDCRLRVAACEGVRRHRRLHVLGCETRHRQLIAWRVHELVLHLARSQVLADQDFDLQDSAWDVAMEAFRGRRQAAGPAEADAARPRPPLPAPAGAPIVVPEAAALESEARKIREAREREAQERQERERKARAREVQAREAQERFAQASAARALGEQAREAWARAAQAPEGTPEHEASAAEARRLDAQAREARERSLTKAAGVPVVEPEAPPPEAPRAAVGAAVSACTASANEVPPTVPQAASGGGSGGGGGDGGAAPCQARATAPPATQPPATGLSAEDGASAVGSGSGPRGRESVARWEREAFQRDALQSEQARQEAAEAPGTRGAQAARREPPQPSAPQQPLSSHGAVKADTTAPARAGEMRLFISLPDIEVADFLASPELSIGRRSGSELSAQQVGCQAVLQVCGPPTANAVACYLLQEALWMRGSFRR